MSQINLFCPMPIQVEGVSNDSETLEIGKDKVFSLPYWFLKSVIYKLSIISNDLSPVFIQKSCLM